MKFKNESGVTLIELLVVMIIIGVLGLIGLKGLVGSNRAEEGARQYAQDNGYTFRSCRDRDSNGDGRVTCEIFRDREGGNEILPIQCSQWNGHCDSATRGR